MTSGSSIALPLHDRAHQYQLYLVPAFALALVGAAIALIDPIAAAVTLAVPIIPFVMYAIIRGAAGNRTYVALFAVMIVVVLAGNMRIRDYADKDIDFQVAIKLCAIAAMAALSTLFMGRIFKGIHIRGILLWLWFFVYTVGTSLYAFNPVVAFVGTASMLTGFLFMCYLCVHIGRDGTIKILLMSGALLCVGSLAVYVAVPSLGRMFDWVNGEFVETSRLQGLFLSSNAAGMSAASLLVLIIAVYSREIGHPRLLGWVAGLSAALCLILSNNRMAMFGLATSAAALYILKGAAARRALFLAAMTLLGLAVIPLFADQILSLVSRSGNWDEITSATGRSRIWAVVIDLWWQTPLMGRGYGSALYILPTHPDLFAAAAHAHSLYLEELFSGGIIALGSLVCCIIVTMALAWRTKAAQECSILLFFLVYGITEPEISGPVSFSLLIVFFAIASILVKSRSMPQAGNGSARSLAADRSPAI